MSDRWRDVLFPGTYRVGKRVVEVDASDCANAVEQGNGMLAEGLSVPFCWEHDQRAKPQYLSNVKDSDLHKNAWLSRGYFARVAAYRLGPEGQVQARPVFDDPEDEKQFDKVKGVSPRLDWDWSDEAGKVWPGLTIGHVASTPRPVQRRLTRVPAMMGHAKGESVYLGYADMPDEKKDGEGDSGGNSATVPPDLIEALRSAGLTIPDEVSTIDDLIIAVKASSGAGEEDTADTTAGTTDAATPPAFMSHLADEVKKGKAEIATIGATRLQARVERLFENNCIDGPERTELLAELKGANLSHESVGDDFKLKPVPIEGVIRWLEKHRKPGKFADADRAAADLSHGTKEVPAPETLAAKSGVDEAAADLERRVEKYIPAAKG